ncbi:hypothetical protein K488DRAFT_72766 [Vararia minispora EC-137]|uniref:Uncharacterized protein n=1 Tax=Vararia minispora EC-137 TaxID=1314806 RepID=A0ACB8QDP2_9AGAM|nr:hypothetical protein K488DRAFT_72766 [Vararia minispora EC-137]
MPGTQVNGHATAPQLASMTPAASSTSSHGASATIATDSGLRAQPHASTRTSATATGTAPATTTTDPSANSDKAPALDQPQVPPAASPMNVDGEEKQRTTAQILQSQIDALADFASRVRALRQAPAALLRAGGAGVSFDVASAAKTGFGELKKARERLLHEDVQSALRAAAGSERKDRTDIRGGLRREVRKRRRSPTPESPKPYIPPKARAVFPTPHPPPTPLSAARLPDFMRSFNARQRAQGRRAALHVCLADPRAPREVVPPVLVRFAIPDVLKAFITLDVPLDEDDELPLRDRPLLVENIAVFGSREKVFPSAHDHDRATDPILSMPGTFPRHAQQDMLATYQDVFTVKCAGCERVLSPEGYLPAIARVWHEDDAADGQGRWEARHVSCTASRR